jgi:hypothetical protein
MRSLDLSVPPLRRGATPTRPPAPVTGPSYQSLYRDALNTAHDAGWRAELGECLAAAYAQNNDGRDLAHVDDLATFMRSFVRHPAARSACLSRHTATSSSTRPRHQPR